MTGEEIILQAELNALAYRLRKIYEHLQQLGVVLA